MAAAAIDLAGLAKTFGSGEEAVRALDQVSLAIRPNEFFTLLGPSGCGKTTLLRLIGGFEQPDAGEIRLDGQPITDLPPHRRPVNTVFQSYALFPHLSVADNVGFGLDMLGWATQQKRRRVADMLTLVRLEGYGGRRPSQLSGGQAQRVALARALAASPKVLLLDEPLSALDLKLRKEMQSELKRLQTETGITFVFVTHDQSEALSMSDRIAVMQHGRVLQVGSPREIYETPRHRFVADFIGEINLLEGELVQAPGGAALQLGEQIRLGLPPGVTRAPGRVTAAVRPERAQLVAASHGNGALPARIDQVVYAGTDTTVLLSLAGGQPFRLRIQNRTGAAELPAPGAPVGIEIPPGSLQLLED